jgi:hypothetical protein
MAVVDIHIHHCIVTGVVLHRMQHMQLGDQPLRCYYLKLVKTWNNITNFTTQSVGIQLFNKFPAALQHKICDSWGSHSSNDCEDYCLLACDVVLSGRSSPLFRRNILLPSSGLMSKLRRQGTQFSTCRAYSSALKMEAVHPLKHWQMSIRLRTVTSQKPVLFNPKKHHYHHKNLQWNPEPTKFNSHLQHIQTNLSLSLLILFNDVISIP